MIYIDFETSFLLQEYGKKKAFARIKLVATRCRA